MPKLTVIKGGGVHLHDKARRKLFDALNRGDVATALELKRGIYSKLEPRGQLNAVSRDGGSPGEQSQT